MLRTKFLEAMPAELRFQMQADDPLIGDVCLWTDTGFAGVCAKSIASILRWRTVAGLPCWRCPATARRSAIGWRPDW